MPAACRGASTSYCHVSKTWMAGTSPATYRRRGLELPAGFEPAVSGVRFRHPWPLDDGSISVVRECYGGVWLLEQGSNLQALRRLINNQCVCRFRHPGRNAIRSELVVIVALVRMVRRGQPMRSNVQKTMAAAALLVAAGAGLAAGYAIWGWPTNWYAGHNISALPPGPETDLIRYGDSSSAIPRATSARPPSILPSAMPATISRARIVISTAGSSRSAFRWCRPSRPIR